MYLRTICSSYLVSSWLIPLRNVVISSIRNFRPSCMAFSVRTSCLRSLRFSISSAMSSYGFFSRVASRSASCCSASLDVILSSSFSVSSPMTASMLSFRISSMESEHWTTWFMAFASLIVVSAPSVAVTLVNTPSGFLLPSPVRNDSSSAAPILRANSWEM